MNKPHIHAKVIKAWADGAAIEFFSNTFNKWMPAGTPVWDNAMMYRVKPELKPIQDIARAGWFSAEDHADHVRWISTARAVVKAYQDNPAHYDKELGL